MVVYGAVTKRMPWVLGSQNRIPLVHLTLLFCIPSSALRPWYVLFCQWHGAYERSLAEYIKRGKEGSTDVLFTNIMRLTQWSRTTLWDRKPAVVTPWVTLLHCNASFICTIMAWWYIPRPLLIADHWLEQETSNDSSFEDVDAWGDFKNTLFWIQLGCLGVRDERNVK